MLSQTYSKRRRKEVLKFKIFRTSYAEKQKSARHTTTHSHHTLKLVIKAVCTKMYIYINFG